MYMQDKKQGQLPEFLREYFWDVRFENINIKDRGHFIIKRIIDRGDTSALKWALKHFNLGQIKEVILTSRDISRKTAFFWTFVLDLDPNKVPCLQKPYSPIPFGL